MSEKSSYPLVSPRSPSYERATREFQHPTSTGDAQVAALLARLSEAEQNAAQICATVAQRMEDEPFASVVRDHAILHQARREALARLIEEIGGSAPRPQECREILTQSIDAVARAQTRVEAKRAFEAMRDELDAAYTAASDNERLDEAQRKALAFLAPARMLQA